MGKRIALKSVAGEFAGADLGDGRRSKRLKTISGLLEREPQKGFPRAMGSDAALEGLYRFINNDAFSAAGHSGAAYRSDTRARSASRARYRGA